ncbi:MAG: hypothetical protein AB7F59_09420 [Bdellovibrionales bacterium]
MKLSQKDIPSEVKEFLTKNIDSIGKLEILIFLATHQGKTWTSHEINQELRGNDLSTEKQLSQLVALKVVAAKPTSPVSYIYDASPSDHVVIEKLMAAYGTFRTRVITLIYEKPSEALKTFADAFKFRKDPEDG